MKLPEILSSIWDFIEKRILGRNDIMLDGQLYMRRWRIIHTKWFGLRLHNIVSSDSDRALHDHPFDFISLILKGGYVEFTPPRRTGWSSSEAILCQWYGPGSVIKRKAEDLHRLKLLQEKPAWTLVLRGRMRREWGFVGEDGIWIGARGNSPNVDTNIDLDA